jgi:hypothetical protein
MEVRNIEIKKKKGGYYVVDFELFCPWRHDEWISCWTTIYKKKQYCFNNCIYEKDEEKMGFYKSEFNIAFPKTPEPYLYFNPDVTFEVFQLIHQHELFKAYFESIEKCMFQTNLTHRKTIEQRRENLKRTLMNALERGEYIGVIFDCGNRYIPHDAIVFGSMIYDRLPGGELFRMTRDEETNEEKEKTCLRTLRDCKDMYENTHLFYRYSMVWCHVDEKGEEKDEWNSIFLVDHPEDVIFYGELFFTDLFPSLLEEMANDEEYKERLRKADEFYWDDKYAMAESLLFDDDGYYEWQHTEFCCGLPELIQKMKKELGGIGEERCDEMLKWLEEEKDY